MGRKVQVRANYINDARFLLRIVEALEKDPYSDSVWKTKAIGLAKELSQMFIQQSHSIQSAANDE